MPPRGYRDQFVAVWTASPLTFPEREQRFPPLKGGGHGAPEALFQVHLPCGVVRIHAVRNLGVSCNGETVGREEIDDLGVPLGAAYPPGEHPLALTACRWYIAQPRMRGFRWQMSVPAAALLSALMRPRTFRSNVLMLFAEGLMSSLPWYVRRCWPRKSTPSAICVMTVFSGERVSPRSFRNAATSGFTSSSRSAFVAPVITTSSARRMKLTLGHTCCCPFQT